MRSLIVLCTLFALSALASDSSSSKTVGSSSNSNFTDEWVCEMWLAPSTMEGAGRGIIAGRDMSSEETIDSAVSLTVPSNWIGDWQLQNYVYASEEAGQSMILFGAAMIFNHLLPATIHHYWDTSVIANTSDNRYVPSTSYSPVAHNTTTQLLKYQEIFTSYGDETWFSDRNISIKSAVAEALAGGVLEDEVPFPPPSLVDPEVLSTNGHCLTNVYVARSGKPMGAYGLYASRAFAAGEIVTISPVLTLPKAEVAGLDTESVLQNYCFSPPNSSVAVFPIAYSAIANHDEQPNMEMEWYSWPNDPPGKLQDTLALSVEALFSKAFAQLDVAYRATRAIEADEELTISYGGAWIHAWAEHLAFVVEFDALEEADKKTAEAAGERPYFRQFISPEGLAWPDAWREAEEGEEAPTCVGEECHKHEIA